MPFFSSKKGQIPRLRQQILVSGRVDHTIWCNTVSVATGLEPATASFHCPRLVWESNLRRYREAFLILNVGAAGGPFTRLFSGYVDTNSASLSPDGNHITFSAKSVLAWLKKICVGHGEKVPVRNYKLLDPATGEKTNTTVKSILQGIWSARQ
jgi:hypothetical protein